jgi:enterochelin esterase family protein
VSDVEIPYVRHATVFPVHYAHGPDSHRRPGVPRGTIHASVWNTSRVFPGTTRRYWVYEPVQYTASEPASLMVFQDGHLYLDSEGEMRVPVVFDNLIHRGEMPVTIGVFVDPGEPARRNLEYDTFSDAYATFLLTEIIPNVRNRFAVTDDPEQWAIGGGSSGGSCAFTVAWMRPDRFRRVLSFLGSFAQIRGGNRYPALIQEAAKKPLRIFLQAATRDLNWDAAERNWFSANLRVAAALAERGYDLRLVLGDGGHDPNHGGAILPDALRWLWRATSATPS